MSSAKCCANAVSADGLPSTDPSAESGSWPGTRGSRTSTGGPSCRVSHRAGVRGACTMFCGTAISTSDQFHQPMAVGVLVDIGQLPGDPGGYPAAGGDGVVAGANQFFFARPGFRHRQQPPRHASQPGAGGDEQHRARRGRALRPTAATRPNRSAARPECRRPSARCRASRKGRWPMLARMASRRLSESCGSGRASSSSCKAASRSGSSTTQATVRDGWPTTRKLAYVAIPTSA